MSDFDDMFDEAEHSASQMNDTSDGDGGGIYPIGFLGVRHQRGSALDRALNGLVTMLALPLFAVVLVVSCAIIYSMPMFSNEYVVTFWMLTGAAAGIFWPDRNAVVLALCIALGPLGLLWSWLFGEIPDGQE